MVIKLKNTALTGDRFWVSDRIMVAIASSVLQEFGTITNDDYSHVINKNKHRKDKMINSIEF